MYIYDVMNIQDKYQIDGANHLESHEYNRIKVIPACY